MHCKSMLYALFSILLFLGTSGPALASEVGVVYTSFRITRDGDWNVRTTLHHEDTGWDHYTDAWRVIGEDGHVYGTRTLLHPHVDEQPFTRTLGDVSIPKDVAIVYVEAHDSVHGWSPHRVKVYMHIDLGENFDVIR